jgi:uncharacterized membrane protein required for colicin V production
MDIITRLNWIDVIVIIVILRTSYVAFQDGLSHEIFPLIGAVGTLILALHYYNAVALIISRTILPTHTVVAVFFSFLALVIIIGLIFRLLRGIVDAVVKVSWHPALEKFGGLVVGVIRASVVASTVLIILALLPLPYIQWSIREKAVTGMYFLRIGPEIYSKTAALLPAAGKAITKESLINDIVSDKAALPEKARASEPSKK